jgi:hypothetical protein
MPRSILTEARPEARVVATEATAGRRQRIELITPGWGSSAYYPPEVLEAAGAAGVFPAGTHMYMDHRRGDGSRVDERGNRSVRDLAAVLAEAAVWDPTAGEDGLGALVAESTVFAPYSDLLGNPEFTDAIGVSVIAVAEVETGTAEGRRGTIVRQIVEGRSCDFVTRAGRGGRIVQILESAGQAEVTESRNIGQWIESRIHRDFTVTADDMAGDGRLTREERISLSSAIGDALNAFVTRLEADQPQLYARDLWDNPVDTVAAAMESHRLGIRRTSEASANDRREQLDTAVRETYADTDDNWAWVRDFDEDRALVWFERGGEVVGTFEQAYTTTDDDASVQLTGDPTEVAVRTTYVPVDPAGRTTEESQEDTMAEVTIEEAELNGLREDAGRVQTIESENSTLRLENARLQARDSAVTHARTRVTEANGDLPSATVDRIVATATTTVPLTESGQLDTAALDTAVDTARTAEETYLAGIQEAAGVGTVRSFGKRTGDKAEVAEGDVDAMIRRRAGTEQKGA